jgi:hypothetical protein
MIYGDCKPTFIKMQKSVKVRKRYVVLLYMIFKEENKIEETFHNFMISLPLYLLTLLFLSKNPSAVPYYGVTLSRYPSCKVSALSIRWAKLC